MSTRCTNVNQPLQLRDAMTDAMTGTARPTWRAEFALARRHCLRALVQLTLAGWSAAALCAPALAPAPAGDGLLAVAELRIGVERLVKLRLELAVLGDQGRHRLESRRELSRVRDALGMLRADSSLSVRRRGQIERLNQELEPLLGTLEPGAGLAPAEGLDALYRESEALAARISFISTGLSAERADPRVGALVDLLTRGAAMALRMGKLNFVASRPGVTPGQAVQVDLLQTLIEFKSALATIDGHPELDERMKDELTLIKHQWLLFSAALSDKGLAKNPARLPDVGTTTDRIAQTLMSVARRAWTAGRTREAAARGA